MLRIDEVAALLDAMCEELPQEFYRELNGGVCLQPDEVTDEDDPDVLIMGEYCRDELGRYINIYYGSFAAVCRGWTRREIERELRETLRHEFTHHIESLAGERGLEIRDALEKEAREEKKKRNGRR